MNICVHHLCAIIWIIFVRSRRPGSWWITWWSCWLTTLYTFQLCDFIIRYMCTLPCVYHPKSPLLPPAYIRAPLSSSSFPYWWLKYLITNFYCKIGYCVENSWKQGQGQKLEPGQNTALLKVRASLKWEFIITLVISPGNLPHICLVHFKNCYYRLSERTWAYIISYESLTGK